MSNLQQLLAQQAELEKKIEVTRSQERADAVGKVKALMAEYGLSVADLGGRSSGGATRTARKLAPKFRDAAGNTWSGRGLKPKWLTAALATGKKLTDFAI